jgi:putative FmdB family regulatory protein
MPTYEYKCSSCGHKWDKFQSIMAAPIKACPACGKRTAQRLIGTGSGVIFKGSGFYQTDYRSDSYKERAKKDNDSAKPAAETATKPADSKSTDSAKPAVEAKPAAEKSTPAPAASTPPAAPPKAKSSSAKRAR